MSACRLVDMVLGDVQKALVEVSLVSDDRFDDLTTIESNGKRERIQLKHTDADDKRLSAATFTNDSRRLRLDRLFASILADRHASCNGTEVPETLYRVVLRDGTPIDIRLTAVLVAPSNDPGPFVQGLRTKRFSFDPDALWAQLNSEDSTGSDSNAIFSFLRNTNRGVSLEELVWVCARLVIEVNAPPTSGDLSNPGVAEQFFLTRVREEIGAGHFPNKHRSASEVGASMIGMVRAARQGRVEISRAGILSRAQLQSDFGAITRADPVDASQKISRARVAELLALRATEVSNQGGLLTIVGPPGHGKSWLCQQMLEELQNRDWLVAEHYCYLGDADEEKTERVLADRIFGSLVSCLIDADPSLSIDHFPRFAADVEALEQLLIQSRSRNPDRPVALVVDGIDHVTRVLAGGMSQFDPSSSLAESLAGLNLPTGTITIVLTQPGSHTKPLVDAGAEEVEVDGFDENEIKSLAVKAGIIPREDDGERAELLEPVLGERVACAFLDALVARSGGNALYAMYLCREIKQRDQGIFDPVQVIEALPSYNDSLENYYEHLCESLGQESGWVADVMALVDFALSGADLRSIRPDAAHRVDRALELLAPVLVYRATQGGFLIYHESFARYLRRAFDGDEFVATSLTSRISRWLEAKGLFKDARAYQSLIPLMAAAKRHNDVVEIVSADFVIRSIESGFPASAINKNIASVIQSASALGDWPSIVRCIELSRSAEAFQFGQFDSTLSEFADVPIALLGAQTVAERLIHETGTVVPARVGLHLCAILDAQGAVAPWLQYMRVHARELATDNTVYRRDSDIAVSLAWLRGRLRLASTANTLNPPSANSAALHAKTPATANVGAQSGDIRQLSDPLAPFSWKALSEQIGPNQLPVQAVASIVLDTWGLEGIHQLIGFVEEKGDLCIAVAQHLTHIGSGGGELDPIAWAKRAANNDISPGMLHEIVKLGIPIDQVAKYSIDEGRERLVALTLRVQDRLTGTEIDSINQWLDECTTAAQRDPRGLDAAEATVLGAGWHKCWLRYAISLAKAEAGGNNKQGLAEAAFQKLTEDLNPFAGDPRACDLYGIHDAIESTIRRGAALITGAALDRTLRLLLRVSNSVTTSLRGMIGGPLPPRLIAQIASDANSRAGSGVAREILQESISDHSSGRYYADIAEMHLRHARLSLSYGDIEQARCAWRTACELLAGYRFRKDITVFELLDPLPALIEVDRVRSEKLLTMMRPLCLRVVNHTDGSETNWAPAIWWRSLSNADPLAMAKLAADRLLSDCNDGNDLLHGALEDLWRHWHANADPLLAACLRLSIDSPLESSDAHFLARFSRELDLGDSSNQGLATWVLARADERPVAYPYSNGHEHLARDDQQVEEINLVAYESDLPLVCTIPEFRSIPAEPVLPKRRSPELRVSDFPIWSAEAPPFMVGSSGIGQAIRAWSKRPYKPTEWGWEVDRFANAIGYRLLELINDGRMREVDAALRLLGEYTRFGERTDVWLHLAEGFERHGVIRSASIAYTIPWIHARRQGGSAHIADLERAMSLDASAAIELLTNEIRNVCTSASGSFETLGFTKALVYGFAVGALRTDNRPSVDLAFECWNAAFQVIALRAPRIDESDDPSTDYEPLAPDRGLVEQREVDEAFALAIVASLTHPARGKKRRVLLAIRTLISKRPELAGTVLDYALARLTCAATTTWLLGLLEQSCDSRIEAISQCRQSLTQLANSDFFTVRNIANRLLDRPTFPIAKPFVPSQVAMATQAFTVLTPGLATSPESDQGVAELIQSVAGKRIEESERFWPGIRQTVTGRVTRTLNTQQNRQRLREFSREFLSPVAAASPDTFDVLHETVENQLQLVARELDVSEAVDPAGYRVAPEELNSIFQSDPSVALEFEALRIPRPPAAWLPAIDLDSIVPAREPQSKAQGDTAEEKAPSRRGHFGSHELHDVSKAGTLSCGPRRDWRLLAAVERIRIRKRELGGNRAISTINVRALEIREQINSNGIDSPPLSQGDISHWFIDPECYPLAPPHIGARPMFGIDCKFHLLDDGCQCLAGHQCLVTPTLLFRLVLGLEPTSSFVLRDDDGDAAALTHWRTAYEASNYELNWPQLVGCGVLVRPDLCEKLLSLTDGALVLRDYAQAMI